MEASRWEASRWEASRWEASRWEASRWEATHTFLPFRRNKVSSIATTTSSVADTSSATTGQATARPTSSAFQRARAKRECARSRVQAERQPRPGRLGGAGPGSDVGDGGVGGVTAGDDAVGREDEPVGTGETSVLEVDLETVALALALGWLLDAGAGPGIDEGGLAIRAATTVATAAT